MQTKFSIGDTIWFMWCNQPTSEEVSAIKVLSKPKEYDENGNITSWHEPVEFYAYWDCDGNSDFISGDRCFATKEELQKAVFGE